MSETIETQNNVFLLIMGVQRAVRITKLILKSLKKVLLVNLGLRWIVFLLLSKVRLMTRFNGGVLCDYTKG